MLTAADLRTVGYTVDDTTTPGTWVVTGLGTTWTFPADDQDTASQVYGLALNADNVTLRTTAEAKLAELDNDLNTWDTLDQAAMNAALKSCIQVVVNLARLTIRKYGS